MSRDQLYDEAPLEDVEQLVEYFRGGVKTAEDRGIGTEHEKFLFRGPECARVQFDGPGGIEEILGRMAEQFGYEPQLDQGRLVALVRGGEAVTLEPGGQFELSGRVTRTIFETRDEFDRHIAELREVCGPDYAAVSFGLTPFDSLEDVEWVPKSRYGVMSRYLATRGDLAHWMMKATCTIQANLDYTSEEDAVDIINTAVLVAPLVNALFANSSVREGQPTGMQSFRAHVWTRTDPDRTGVPEFMFRNDWGFREWAEWVVNVPMFFVRRENRYVDLAGRSFRDLMEGRIDGLQATMGDFELHLSTVFPEVRMKRFIEVRSADGGPREHVFALPALYKGIIYDLDARRAARELVAGVGPTVYAELAREAAMNGIHGTFGDTPIADLCGALVDIASQGLSRLADAAAHPDETEFLEPLRHILTSRESAADRLLARFGDRHGVIGSRDLLA